MSDIVKRPGWNRQFKSHDKVNKRLMTGAEAAERDANNKEQAAAWEARQEANFGQATSFVAEPVPLAGPPPPPPSTAPVDVKSVLNTPLVDPPPAPSSLPPPPPQGLIGPSQPLTMKKKKRKKKL